MRPQTSEKVSRIAIVSSYFGNIFHPPSALANSYAHTLCDLGIAVNMFSCQELLPYGMSNYHGASRLVQLPKVDSTRWAQRIPQSCSIFIANEAGTMLSRWEAVLQEMGKFNPDLILAVGPYSPLVSALYTVRPIVALPTNTVSFLGEADLWLKGMDAKFNDAEITWDDEFSLPESYLHPYRIAQPKIQKILSRAQFDIDDNAIVLVSVGFRLDVEIDGQWANLMTDFLKAHPNVVWVLIGVKSLVSLDKVPKRQMIYLDSRSDVIDVLALCDIYVNPPRMGGGFSVLEAMGIGLPVIAYSNTDGGEKLGNNASENHENYMQKLSTLVKNPLARKEYGVVLSKRFAECYDINHSGQSLIEACSKAMERAKARL